MMPDGYSFFYVMIVKICSPFLGIANVHVVTNNFQNPSKYPGIIS